jgi:hypothetical protein
MRSIGLTFCLLLAAAFCSAGVPAKELGQPAGQAILTIAGDIGATNRGPFDAFEDAFFKHHNRHFDKAAAFDAAMLEALGMHEVTVSYAKWPRAFRFEGPWLKDVLAAAGADGKDISILALDGFATEISAADLAAYDWIVAVKRDGRYLDIGQRGPLWVVYARRDGKAITEADEQRWPWAAFLIEVK